jgi:hypothetical protein
MGNQIPKRRRQSEEIEQLKRAVDSLETRNASLSTKLERNNAEQMEEMLALKQQILRDVQANRLYREACRLHQLPQAPLFHTATQTESDDCPILGSREDEMRQDLILAKAQVAEAKKRNEEILKNIAWLEEQRPIRLALIQERSDAKCKQIDERSAAECKQILEEHQREMARIAEERARQAEQRRMAGNRRHRTGPRRDQPARRF